MFKAQLIKDIAMAHRVNELIAAKPNENYLVIAGFGHLLHYAGVPENVFAKKPTLRDDSLLIVAHEFNATVDSRETDENAIAEGV